MYLRVVADIGRRTFFELRRDLMDKWRYTRKTIQRYVVPISELQKKALALSAWRQQLRFNNRSSSGHFIDPGKLLREQRFY
jgi:hypothetical protein